MKRCISRLLILVIAVISLSGCGNVNNKDTDKVMQENVVFTETGEVLIKEQPTEQPIQESEETALPMSEESSEPISIDIDNVQIDLPNMNEKLVEKEPIEPSGSGLQIVFLGDSIFDFHRDGTGVPYLTAKQCDADVYNLAIGGTSATLEDGEPTENEEWTSRSLVGVVKAMRGDITTDIFAKDNAKRILDDPNVDFSTTDYFVIEYGINDFFRAVPLDNQDETFDCFTYVGALRYAVDALRELAPDATIILCTPHYCQFFKNNQYVGDSNTLHNGKGTLFDYKGKCSYVAREQNIEWFDTYYDLGIDGYTAKDYLEDGVHLTEEGRQLYADILARKILKIEETKNN